MWRWFAFSIRVCSFRHFCIFSSRDLQRVALAYLIKNVCMSPPACRQTAASFAGHSLRLPQTSAVDNACFGFLSGTDSTRLCCVSLSVACWVQGFGIRQEFRLQGYVFLAHILATAAVFATVPESDVRVSHSLLAFLCFWFVLHRVRQSHFRCCVVVSGWTPFWWCCVRSPRCWPPSRLAIRCCSATGRRGSNGKRRCIFLCCVWFALDLCVSVTVVVFVLLCLPLC